MPVSSVIDSPSRWSCFGTTCTLFTNRLTRRHIIRLYLLSRRDKILSQLHFSFHSRLFSCYAFSTSAINPWRSLSVGPIISFTSDILCLLTKTTLHSVNMLHNLSHTCFTVGLWKRCHKLLGTFSKSVISTFSNVLFFLLLWARYALCYLPVCSKTYFVYLNEIEVPRLVSLVFSHSDILEDGLCALCSPPAVVLVLIVIFTMPRYWINVFESADLCSCIKMERRCMKICYQWSTASFTVIILYYYV